MSSAVENTDKQNVIKNTMFSIGLKNLKFETIKETARHPGKRWYRENQRLSSLNTAKFQVINKQFGDFFLMQSLHQFTVYM